jgi:hypothetical protein
LRQAANAHLVLQVGPVPLTHLFHDVTGLPAAAGITGSYLSESSDLGVALVIQATF